MVGINNSREWLLMALKSIRETSTSETISASFVETVLDALMPYLNEAGRDLIGVKPKKKSQRKQTAIVKLEIDEAGSVEGKDDDDTQAV